VTSVQNNGNCLNLTRELIVGIFNGTINRWSDPLLVQYNRALRSVNNTINVIVRSDHSGITNILTSYLAAVDVNWKATFSSFPDGCDLDGLPIKWSSNVTIRCGAKGQGISGIISNLKYSIGYLASSDARDNLLPEARIQNKANQWVTASVMGTQAAMDSTVDNIDRRLTASLVDPPSREAYPISGYSYLLIRKKSMQNCTTAMELYR
jgi:phosphate transport system substrate-binding protein